MANILASVSALALRGIVFLRIIKTMSGSQRDYVSQLSQASTILILALKLVRPDLVATGDEKELALWLWQP